jgi:hypothetical protein
LVRSAFSAIRIPSSTLRRIIGLAVRGGRE